MRNDDAAPQPGSAARRHEHDPSRTVHLIIDEPLEIVLANLAAIPLDQVVHLTDSRQSMHHLRRTHFDALVAALLIRGGEWCFRGPGGASRSMRQAIRAAASRRRRLAQRPDEMDLEWAELNTALADVERLRGYYGPAAPPVPDETWAQSILCWRRGYQSGRVA